MLESGKLSDSDIDMGMQVCYFIKRLPKTAGASLKRKDTDACRGRIDLIRMYEFTNLYVF